MLKSLMCTPNVGLGGPGPRVGFGVERRPNAFAGNMAYKATKPGSICHLFRPKFVSVFLCVPGLL